MRKKKVMFRAILFIEDFPHFSEGALQARSSSSGPLVYTYTHKFHPLAPPFLPLSYLSHTNSQNHLSSPIQCSSHDILASTSIIPQKSSLLSSVMTPMAKELMYAFKWMPCSVIFQTKTYTHSPNTLLPSASQT